MAERTDDPLADARAIALVLDEVEVAMVARCPSPDKHRDVVQRFDDQCRQKCRFTENVPLRLLTNSGIFALRLKTALRLLFKRGMNLRYPGQHADVAAYHYNIFRALMIPILPAADQPNNARSGLGDLGVRSQTQAST